jgi:inosose dehydratase
MSALRVGNAPLSYGAFEMTVGIYPNVPGAERYLDEVSKAGFVGTELGVPGYLGEGEELRRRLDERELAMTGGWCPIHFSEPEHWDEDLAALDQTLALFAAAGATDAHPVFGDGGSEARWANPGRGQEDRSLGLDQSGWARFLEGLGRAEDLARARGFEPTFHPHTSTHVEAPWEIERLLETSDIGLLVDTGHLLLGGSDPIDSVRSWGPRVNYVHVKDVRLAVLETVIRDGADALEAWRRGIFCELGEGDVDLDGFFAALTETGYAGWVVLEQDRILRDDEPLDEAIEAQIRNRQWLRTHPGL